MNKRSRRGAVLPLLAVVAALAGCASLPAGTRATTAGTHASPAASHLATVTPSSRNAAAATGALGRNGAAAWSITPNGVYVSFDAGRNFAQVALPAAVTAPNVMAVAARANRQIWLAAQAAGGPSFTLYARDSATARWSQGVRLTPTWPTNLGGAEKQAGGASIIPGGPGQVLVLSQLQLTHSVAVPRLFVSADSGITFTQRSIDVDSPWDSVAILGANVVGVVGELFNHVVHSGDTGATWSPAVVNDVTSGRYVAGTPVLSGTMVYLPVTEPDAKNNGVFVLLRSTDGGATFNAAGAETLSLGGPYDENPTAVAAAGASWWLVSPTGSVYRSTDNGSSWSKAAGLLPQGVASIGATDSQNATVTIEQNACTAGKTNCSSGQYFETTSDGGKTWTQT